MSNLKDYIYDWVFHYDIYNKVWRGVKRDNYNELFNGGKNILKSKNFDTLLEIINKTNGDNVKLKKLINDSKTT